MQIHGHHAVRTGGRQEVGHELGADGRTRADLAVLTGIAVVRDDGGDAARTGALERVEHEAELHQVEVHGRTGRLDDEHVVAADAAADFDAAFAVAELLTQGGGQLAAEMLANGLSQRSVRGACQNLEITVHRGGLPVKKPLKRKKMAGAEGLEPSDDGTKTRCLTCLATPQRDKGFLWKRKPYNAWL